MGNEEREAGSAQPQPLTESRSHARLCALAGAQERGRENHPQELLQRRLTGSEKNTKWKIKSG